MTGMARITASLIDFAARGGNQDLFGGVAVLIFS